MAELLSVHVHYPQRDDIDVLKEKQRFQRNSSVAGTEKKKYDLPRKKNLDIEFRDLTYTVKDGNHKGIWVQWHDI